MTDKEIYKWAGIFREAIIAARDENLFRKDISFDRFPRGCCGDTCYLLATFLRTKGVKTLYVWRDYHGQSHAWLVVNDDRVKEPTPRFYETPIAIREALKLYGNAMPEGPVEITCYEEGDVADGLIIDITADQFGKSPVYVGYSDDFYKSFAFESAHECDELGSSRLHELYQIVACFLS